MLVYRLDQGEAPSSSQPVLDDKELVGLSHISPQPGRKFRPAFALIAGHGTICAFALSDIGFLASAYADGSLFVVDMRGPKIILRDTSGTKEENHSLLHGHQANPVVSLTWTVTGTSTGTFFLYLFISHRYSSNPHIDRTPRILLIAVRASSATTIHTVLRSQNGAWTVKTHPEKTEAASHPFPGGSIVINTTGYSCNADRNGLSVALTPPTNPSEVKRSIWVTAGSKGVRCVADITGEKLGRTEWGSKVGKVEQVEVVRKNGRLLSLISCPINPGSNVELTTSPLAAAVLVAYTDRRQAAVYSLPFLEHLHTLQMVQTSSEYVFSLFRSYNSWRNLVLILSLQITFDRWHRRLHRMGSTCPIGPN